MSDQPETIDITVSLRDPAGRVVRSDVMARFTVPWSENAADRYSSAYAAALGVVPRLRDNPFDLVLVSLEGPRGFLEAVEPSFKVLLEPSARGMKAALEHLPGFAGADVALAHSIAGERLVSVTFGRRRHQREQVH